MGSATTKHGIIEARGAYLQRYMLHSQLRRGRYSKANSEEWEGVGGRKKGNDGKRQKVVRLSMLAEFQCVMRTDI